MRSAGRREMFCKSHNSFGIRIQKTFCWFAANKRIQQGYWMRGARATRIKVVTSNESWAINMESVDIIKPIKKFMKKQAEFE